GDAVLSAAISGPALFELLNEAARRGDPPRAQTLRDILHFLLAEQWFIDRYGHLKSLLLVDARVRSLLHLDQHGVIDHAEAVAPAHHEHDVAFPQFARGHQLTVIVVKIHFAAALADHQHFGSAHQM